MLSENKKQDKNESVYKHVSKLGDTSGRATTSSWLYLGSLNRHRTSSRQMYPSVTPKATKPRQLQNYRHSACALYS